MTVERDGSIRVYDVTQGLVDRLYPVQAEDGSAVELQGFHLNRMSAEERYGARKLNYASPRHGGVRFSPYVRRTSSETMTRWWDGYLWAPTRTEWTTEPKQIDFHFRVEDAPFYPESYLVNATKQYAGVNGRFASVVGTRRTGGEHQFMPLISRGAREVERPWWSVGYGVVRPEGLRDAGSAAGQPDRICPVFYWWDEAQTRLRVAACDYTLIPTKEYSITVVLTGTPKWYVNGVVQAEQTGVGLSALPSSLSVSQAPVYFGRCFTREPNIKYDSTTGFTRKNAYMGKWNLTVSSVTATLIRIQNQQLAFGGAGANAYVGYRIRVLQGTDAGRIYTITAAANQANDATIEFTVGAHSVTAGKIVDVIPAVEPVCADTTLQEVRFWDAEQSASTIAAAAGIKGFSDRRSPRADKFPLQWLAAANAPNLQAYWPLDDDGGNVCLESVRGAHAVFAPSAVAIVNGPASAIGGPSLFLDGETHALGIGLEDNPNLGSHYADNLGRLVGSDNHYNVAARLQFMLGGSMEPQTVGGFSQGLFQVLFSIGDQAGTAPRLEARVFNNAGSHQVYFSLPDGTFSGALTAFTLVPGQWYNAIIGIEALTPGSQQHHVYVQIVDADQGVQGDIVAVASLGRVPLDTTKENTILFGASVRGNDQQGVQRNNHALLAISSCGIGFHPIHTAASTAIGSVSDLVTFSAVRSRLECTPPLIGPDGGLTLTQDSLTATVVSSENVPASVRRWPIEVQHVDMVLKRSGEADRIIPKQNIVASVSGRVLTLCRIHTLPTVVGAEARAVAWSAYSNLETFDPAEDTDLNAGRDTNSNFAMTENVFPDLMNQFDGLRVLIDPTYEFVSPLRLIPRWSRGVVLALDSHVSAMAEYSRQQDLPTIASVVGGSLFELDTRWRRDHPFLDNGYSFLIRRPIQADAIRASELKPGARLFGQAFGSAPNEGIVLSSLVGIPQDSIATTYTWELSIKLDGIDGRRTLFSATNLRHGSFGGQTRWGVDKTLHAYLADGYLVFEQQSESASISWRWRSTYQAPIVPGRWAIVLVQLTANGPPDVINNVQFYVDGASIPATRTGAATFPNSGAPLASTLVLGAVGDPSPTGMFFCDQLGGLIGGFTFALDNPMGSSYTPVKAGDANWTSGLTLQDGSGSTFAELSGGYGYFAGEEMIHVGSGMKHPQDGRVAMAVFNETLYVTTGRTRVWRWDRVEFTSAGIRPPAGRLRSVSVTRWPARVASHGCDIPAAPGRTSLCDLQGAAPHIRTWTPASPLPSAAEVGCLVYIPSDPDMGGGLWPCGYIGLVSAVATAGTPGYTVTPAPMTEQQLATANLAWSLFKKAQQLNPSTWSFLKALALIESTTPWGERRLLCDGKDENSVPVDETLAEGQKNGGALHFRGNFFVESPPFRADGIPLARGKVLNVKGYIRIDSLEFFGDEKQVIVEQAIDADSGSFRISLLSGGRLEFEFFDTVLGKFRSIRTVGKVISPKQWFYVQVRYKFKAGGLHVHDAVGGWEPDLRWLRKAGGTSVQKTRDFRDGIWVYACEGLHQKSDGYQHADTNAGYIGDVDEGAPCPLLTIPGCESQVGATVLHGAVSTHNHSQHLLNTGLLKAAPYLTPEEGDSLFPAAGVNASSPHNGIVVTLAVNTIGSLLANPPGPAANCQITLPAGFALPRTCSMNRDDAWNRGAHSPHGLLIEESTQVFLRTAGTVRQNYYSNGGAIANTNVTYAPNLAVFGLVGGASIYGKQEAWAVLLRVWTMVANGGGVGAVGSFPDGASAGVPRVFAIVHLAATDLGTASRGGTSGHQLFITDDPIYGGDGLGSLKIGAVACAATSTWHATIELMNGSNQASTSTNRLVVPTLLEHGDNPVGVGDSPDQTDAPIRFGGTLRQGDAGTVRNGLKGRLDDWGILIASLNSSAANIYTTDCLPPDAFFTGPKDTRIQSLPRLNFVNNAAILDDASGAPASRATVVYRFDQISGTQILKDTVSIGGQVPSAQEAPNAYILNQGSTIQTRGTHRLRTTYYDPRLKIESNPSEEFVVVVDGKEGAGDVLEAETLFGLVGLPVSGDRRRQMFRRIYKTDADAGLPLRLAEVKDNTTTQVFPRMDNAKLSVAPTIDFANGRPPICMALMAGERNMFYAGVDDAPNVVAISRADTPDLVDGLQQVYGESGRGAGIIGLAHLRGVVVAFKNNGLFVIRPAGAQFSIRRVGQNVGSLSHNAIVDLDGVLFFPSEKGIYVYAGNEQAWPASEMIERLWRTGLNMPKMTLSQGAPNDSRGQYIVSVVRSTEAEPGLLVSGERRTDKFGNPFQVWSTIDLGISVNSMCDFRDPDSMTSRVAIGGNQGSMLLDVGVSVGVPDDSVRHGGLTGVVSASLGPFGFNMTPAGNLIDGTKDHLNGMPVLITHEVDASGSTVATGQGVDFVVDQQSVIVLVKNPRRSTSDIYVRGPLSGGTIVGKDVWIGGATFAFRSKWFSVERPESYKSWEYLDLVFEPVPGVAVFLAVYQDMLTTPSLKARVPLDAGVFSVPLCDIKAKHIQFRLSGYGLRTGFVLHRAVLRSVVDDSGVREK